MKQIKCLLSVLLGIVLGLCASCSKKPAPTPPETKDKPGTEKADNTGKQDAQKPAPPEKKDGMPIREPVFE